MLKIMTTGQLLAMLFLFVGFNHSIYSQRSFYDRFDNIFTWPNIAVTTNADGGVTLANDLANPSSENEKHGFYLTSYDSCAVLSWTREYKREDFALFFSDLAILPSGELLAAGQTGQRDIFLIKMDPNGETQWMKTYEASVYDQCFSLSIFGNEVYLFGSFQDQNRSRSLLLKLDQEGNLIWSRANLNFIGQGSATAGQEEIICRVDNQLFALSHEGIPLWARQIDGLNSVDAFYSNIVTNVDGFALAWLDDATGGQHISLFDENGLWQTSSPMLSTYEVPMALENDRNGYFASGTVMPLEADSDQRIALYELDVDLEVMEAQDFAPFPGRMPVQLDIAVQDLGNPVVVGTVNDLMDNTDFVAQFSEDDRDLLCIAQDYNGEEEDSYSPQTSSITLTSSSPIISVVDSLPPPVASPRTANDFRECGWEMGFANLELDSSIQCRDTLHYSPNIENATFRWWDGNTNGDRILPAPGQYQLTATTCRTDFDIQIELRLGYCPCAFFVPNAFSPNGDDNNDRWMPFADCPYRDIELRVFNRWGSPVYESDEIDIGWDGTFRGQQAPSETYIYTLSYEYELQPGLWRSRSQSGTLVLLR